ncbi:hypothetical protein ABNQ38_33570 [Azospirillum sp. A29]|uniref:hypothetical protein n=1 Tax=Azospirillum sp. A29 TaxID=3160606 RepID=UPI00367072CA
MQASAQTALEVPSLDGIGGVLADWMTATAPVAWAPDLSMLAAVSALGALYAGRYVSDGRISTQIYVMGSARDSMVLSHIATATHSINAAIPSRWPDRANLEVCRHLDQDAWKDWLLCGRTCARAFVEWSPIHGRDSVLCLADDGNMQSLVAYARQDTMHGVMVRDLLGRFVFVPATCDRAKRAHFAPAAMPPDIARLLRDHDRQARGGVVRSGTNASDAFSDARQAWRGAGALWDHAETNALKLAMISAISADPIHPIMRQDDADFGIHIISRGIGALAALIER